MQVTLKLPPDVESDVQSVQDTLPVSRHAILLAALKAGLYQFKTHPDTLPKFLQGARLSVVPSTAKHHLAIPSDDNHHQSPTGDASEVASPVIPYHHLAILDDDNHRQVPPSDTGPVMLPFMAPVEPEPPGDEVTAEAPVDPEKAASMQKLQRDIEALSAVADLPGPPEAPSEPEGELDEEGDLIIEEPVIAKKGLPTEPVEDFLSGLFD